MRFSVKPLVIFAQKRQATLDTTSIIPTDDVDATLLIVTKYGLQICVQDGAIRISLISHPHPLEKSVHDDLDGCNSKLPMSTAVTPLPSPETSSVSYRVFPDCFAPFLWYKEYLESAYVGPELVEDLYPALAKFFFDWEDIYNDGIVRHEGHLGNGAGPFSMDELDDLVAWAIEGFFLSCWLALQDNVLEVDYEPNHKTLFNLQKGRLEEELMPLLMDMEEVLSCVRE
ncbi:hypothetical protein V8E54_009850 [Elaphomyces granulatus]